VFRARDILLWCLLGIFVGALSVGFGMIIFAAKGTDYGLLQRLGLTTSEKIGYSIPFFWIIATIIVAVIAFLNFRRMKRSYRVSGRSFAFITALIAVALGSVVYSLNIAEYVDQAASENIPLYNVVVPLNTNHWLDPDHGIISGVVREKNSDKEFVIRDSEFELWRVKGNNVVMPAGFKFQTGDRVKVIGKRLSENAFDAIEIRPWE
jgi:hypothetical protein